MAITSRPPSVSPRNRNKKTHYRATVDAVRYGCPSPELPRYGRKKWHAETVTWRDSVPQMPHCRLRADTDWRFALETALPVELF